MSDSVYLYKYYCTTESSWVTKWGKIGPTTCVNNNGHSIDQNSIYTIDKVESSEVIVKEESVPTGGHFDCRTLIVTAAANTTTNSEISFPMKGGISALSLIFISEEVHRGDVITVYVGKNTTTGSITSNIVLATEWSDQNYTDNDSVIYNGITYTCHTNTLSNEVPTNKTYWYQGFRVSVSQTVIDNVYEGYLITLDDLSNTDSLGRVVEIDTTNNYIYTENGPINTYSYTTPTYIKQSVSVITDFEIGGPWKYEIGTDKIGGSHVPRNVKVSVDYQNKHISLEKKFIGIVEYLY